MSQEIEQLKADNRNLREELREQELRIAKMEQRQESVMAVLKNGIAILDGP